MALWVPYIARNFAQDDDLSDGCLMEFKFKFLCVIDLGVHIVMDPFKTDLYLNCI